MIVMIQNRFFFIFIIIVSTPYFYKPVKQAEGGGMVEFQINDSSLFGFRLALTAF